MDSLITECESLHRKRMLNKKFLVKDYERQKFNYKIDLDNFGLPYMRTMIYQLDLIQLIE